ncbi:unnamed protein product [Tuber aestivum]|uniref:Oxo-4-hydroxy-4-carboxy-5-ureidoimidazoline decarboxylase domain-containing protein n=1 Tax=Tuber aestivum TaxID=59557 RepID=A0A292PPR5_9PEZI|nr:unnamed protein product [Tuber aestivum]
MSPTPFKLPPANTVPTLSTGKHKEILNALFEPCNALNTLALEYLAAGPFESYDDLIGIVYGLLADLNGSKTAKNTEWLLKILAAHPRLGARKVESELSAGEQVSLLAVNTEEEEALKRLNEEYEKKFAGKFSKFLFTLSSLDLITGPMPAVSSLPNRSTQLITATATPTTS